MLAFLMISVCCDPIEAVASRTDGPATDKRHARKGDDETRPNVNGIREFAFAEMEQLAQKN